MPKIFLWPFSYFFCLSHSPIKSGAWRKITLGTLNSSLVDISFTCSNILDNSSFCFYGCSQILWVKYYWNGVAVQQNYYFKKSSISKLLKAAATSSWNSSQYANKVTVVKKQRKELKFGLHIGYLCILKAKINKAIDDWFCNKKTKNHLFKS